MSGQTDIRAVELASFSAWPALRCEPLDGWLLRFAEGHTKRANSVNVLEADPRGLDRRIAAAEARYHAAGLPTIFRLTPLAEPELEARLAARGYRLVDPSLVKTAPIAQGRTRDPSVDLLPAPERLWLDGYVAAAGLAAGPAAALAAMLGEIRGNVAYALVQEGGRAVAFAMAVAEGGRVGFFDVVTLPEFRRRGLSRRIMDTLIAWARDEAGARSMWIQVVEANHVARAFYRSYGFTAFYAYRYRVAP